MGQKATYICNRCNYSVLTSGGHDIGMKAVIDTYTCTSCKEVVDVMVGQYGQVYAMDEVSSLKDEMVKQSEFYTCPECESGDNLIKWDSRECSCPKCGGKMNEDPDGEIMLWD